MRVSEIGESPPILSVSILHIIHVKLYNRREEYCIIIYQYWWISISVINDSLPKTFSHRNHQNTLNIIRANIVKICHAVHAFMIICVST